MGATSGVKLMKMAISSGHTFDHVTTDMTIYREEIFGPVLAVARVNSYDDGAEMINPREFGNGTMSTLGRLTN